MRTRAVFGGVVACGALAIGLWFALVEDGSDDAERARPAASIEDPRKSPTTPKYEVRSHAQKLEPFVLAKYERDPESYLGVVRPERAFQLAKPGPGVDKIRHVTAIFHTIEPRSSVMLAVRVPPRTPATFTSKGGGEFQNGHQSITVEADEDGVARTQFTATPGTVGRAEIFTASPLMGGQVVFEVTIEEQGTKKEQD